MVNEVELAQLFVKFAELRDQIAGIEEKIKAAVLEIGESRKIAGVTATYYKPSHETPDYEGAARSHGLDGFDLSPYTTTTVIVSWKSVCDALFITPAEGREKPARVTVK